MEEFLERHGVPPETVEVFKKNGISLDIFPKLNDEHLKELCPHLGTRIKLSELMTSFATTETYSELSNEGGWSANDDSGLSANLESGSMNTIPSSDLSASDSGPSVINIHSKFLNDKSVDLAVTRAFPDFDLKTLLTTTAGGNSVIKYYETFGTLDSSKRNQLTDIIVKHLYTYAVHCRISHEEYNVLAAKIVTLFPKESPGTYFINPIRKGESPTGKPVVAKGKLVDKVRNLLFKFGERKRPSTETDSGTTSKVIRTEIAGTSNEDVQWLKENSEPWDEVLRRWKKTFPQRRDSQTYVNIHDLFIQWPILNDLRGEQLINSDFDELYPDKNLKFYMNWHEYFKKIILFKNSKDEKVLSILNSLEELDDDLKIPGQINVLVQLLPPKGRLTKKVKFTTQEALDSIFICCPNPGDIDTTIAEQKQKAKAKKLHLQPFIILQGTIYQPSAPLLVIDNIKYKFTSISKAFDTLFKAFHAFHAEYPKASSHIHLVIQRCVYKITTKYDNIVPSIVDVLNL